ncbi:beta-1,4-glucuronyltransferase 1 isoform X2 [Diachasma alloeum]|uniref:beta-1,4-glucuronyltransferase 1 isoform X2 n=1 Tax=Diachasma alloeum TaxID=454923 RepID=UPI000738150A|nr:beta-1,4-glucuronyltransferase 1 isoform X2 [Diachasma alloeum]
MDNKKFDERLLGRNHYAGFHSPQFCLACQHTSMIKLGCRPRTLSLVSVIVLAMSNMFLTFLLLQSETCTSSNNDETLMGINAVTEWNINSDDQSNLEPKNMVRCPVTEENPDLNDTKPLNLDFRLGRWDNRRQYKTFDSILVGSQFSELSASKSICLATQSSLEKLHSLVQVAHHWTASISVALYTAGDEEFEALQKYLYYIRRCYPPIRERVTFSLAVPRNKVPTKNPTIFQYSEDFQCSRPEATLFELMNKISVEHTNWRAKNVYPQNHMRNLARKNCQTNWVFLTDVDIIPSMNLANSLDQFMRRTRDCDKCAYVIPTYELDVRVKFPQNKTELVRLARKGLARPFHWKVFIHNQYATNFTRWISDVTPGAKGYQDVLRGVTYISHNVTNFEFLYEPFYVSKDTAPAHDERFLGYGYTRNTQVYEMFVAGYQFKVLSPVFTVHWGLQSRKNRPGWRERQNIFNRKQFDSFKREIFAKYSTDPLKMVKKIK